MRVRFVPGRRWFGWRRVRWVAVRGGLQQADEVAGRWGIVGRFGGEEIGGQAMTRCPGVQCSVHPVRRKDRFSDRPLGWTEVEEVGGRIIVAQQLTVECVHRRGEVVDARFGRRCFDPAVERRGERLDEGNLFVVDRQVAAIVWPDDRGVRHRDDRRVLPDHRFQRSVRLGQQRARLFDVAKPPLGSIRHRAALREEAGLDDGAKADVVSTDADEHRVEVGNAQPLDRQQPLQLILVSCYIGILVERITRVIHRCGRRAGTREEDQSGLKPLGHHVGVGGRRPAALVAVRTDDIGSREEARRPLTGDERIANRDQARAALARARAIESQRRIDLSRTAIASPFDGRVLSENVSIGDMVQPGRELARLFDANALEISVSLTGKDMSLIDDPWAQIKSEPASAVLTVNHGGKEYEWPARVDRVEAAIDTTTRTFNIVIAPTEPGIAGLAVDGSGRTGPPLVVGMYATARIAGRDLGEYFLLPRRALRDSNRLWVMTPDNEVAIVRAEVLTEIDDNVAVRLNPVPDALGVITSDLKVVTPGMQVRTLTPTDGRSAEREARGNAPVNEPRS